MALDQKPAVKNKESKAKEPDLKKQPEIRTNVEKPPRAKREKLWIEKEAMKQVKLVAVAYSFVEREQFASEEAYRAEKEVEKRAMDVIAELEKLGISAKGYPADVYMMTNLLVDKPDLVLNLVDTLRGKDALSSSIPAALELTNIPYTGARPQGLVIGSYRSLFKQMLVANDIPTPPFQYIHRRGTSIEESLGLPLIAKLNESGGSVGIDNHAVKETIENAEEQVNELIGTYRIPVIVERFLDGPEITVVVVEDSRKKHVFLGQKVFKFKPDGKHAFTSLESYAKPNSYHYGFVEDPDLARKITGYAEKAFTALHNHDYAKFDVRVDKESGEPYFIDANPNTAFGPDLGLPLTEVLALYRIPFSDVLASLVSKYARKIK